LVSVLDSEASLVNERHADDASRVRNLAGAVDCDLLPVAALQRPRLPGELHFLDDAGAIDAGNDARCKADISGIGAVQQARIGMPALDHHEHAALGHGTRFTSSQTAWARFRLVMVVSIVKGPETTHALASAETSRHDDHGADNAEYRRVRPRKSGFHCWGCEDIRTGSRRE